MLYGKFTAPSTLTIRGDSYKYLVLNVNGFDFPVTTNNREMDNSLITHLVDLELKCYVLSQNQKTKDKEFDVVKLIADVEYKKGVTLTLDLTLRTDDNNFKSMFKNLLSSYIDDKNMVLPF